MGESDVITIVSGLPRSGTSMMMKMLEAGGMEVVTDSIRRPDVDNPLGYYEFERVKKIKDDASWLPDARGKVFKMVSMLLFDLPADYAYRVVFMKRDIGEMLDSQEKMLRRLGKEDTSGGREKMAAIYRAHLGQVEDWLAGRKNVEVLYINYRDVIEDPEGNALKVNGFLGGALDAGKMAGAVDGSLYRNRAEPR
jgi:hypothetical protein